LGRIFSRQQAQLEDPTVELLDLNTSGRELSGTLTRVMAWLQSQRRTTRLLADVAQEVP